MRNIAERLKTRNENFQAVAAEWKSRGGRNCRASENALLYFSQNVQVMDKLVESVNKAIDHKNIELATTTMSGAAKKDGLVSLLPNRNITRTLLEGSGLASIIEDWSCDPPLQNEINTFVEEIQ